MTPDDRKSSGTRPPTGGMRQGRSLFWDNARDILLIVGLDGRILDANPAAVAAYGYSLEELKTLRIHDLRDPATVSEVENQIRIAEREGILFETVHRRRDGTLFPVEVSSRSGKIGRRKALLSIIRDISARRKAEEALRSRTELLESIVRVSPLAIVTFDAEGKIGMWNPAAERMFGWTAKEAAGKFHPIVPKEKEEEFRRIREEALAGKVFSGLELRRKRKDGSDIDITVSTSPIRDPDGTVIGVMSILTDITDRKRAERELRLLATAIEQSAETVMITDRNGTILYVNPAFEKITGYAREEAIGADPRMLKSGKQGEDFYRRMWGTILRGDVWSGVFVNRKKDGTLYEEEAILSPVRDAAGEIVNFVAVKRDVTQERRMEEELRHAQKMEAVGRLAGGVAHDFNNLLTAITGYSQMLLERLGEEDPSRKEIAEIRKAGERAAALTRQLLAFSSKQVLRPKVMDLNSVVSDMRKMLRRLIGEDIELVTVYKDDTAFVRADPGQVEQVLANLVVNARDAMPQGGRLLIETASVDLAEEYVSRHDPMPPGRYVMLAVTDSGCGMDGATLSRIFEPFFTTKPKGKGTGLGLSTVYGIVKQSGGYIWAYSEPGKGTVFRIYLPRVEPEAASPEKGDAPAIAGEGAETILVTEDEEMVRDLVCTILRRNGYRVLEARDGEEALEVVERHEGPIHLLVTDVVMPRIGGPELAERLAQLRPGIRVLFISGYTDTAVTKLGMITPGSAFLEKPFVPGALVSRVRTLLDAS
ncbi:MAG: hypothetical protein Kow00128_02040 [Deltaproteobacteria bacterium]